MSVSPVLQGMLWMTASTASFSVMIIVVRALSDSLPPFEQVFLRSLIGLAITLMTFKGALGQVIRTFKPNRLGGIFALRSFCTFVGVSAWFFAIAALPLAEAVSLHFTLPIFGLILSALVLREKVTQHRLIAVAIGFLGVLIILRPGVAVFEVMVFAVFLSALGYAAGDICTKLLTRTEHPGMIVLNLNIWLILFSAVPAILYWEMPLPSDIPLILIMGITGWTAHICLARAMQCADASIVIPLEFIRLPITACLAYFLFSEVPGIWAVVGAGVILYGTWRLAIKEGRTSE